MFSVCTQQCKWNDVNYVCFAMRHYEAGWKEDKIRKDVVTSREFHNLSYMAEYDWVNLTNETSCTSGEW